MERPLYKHLWKELASEKPMIFLSGPRQAGKTTFAKGIAASEFSQHDYFNWDLITHKKKLIENPTFFEQMPRTDAKVPLVIFDEIHKYRKWKNYLKGVYDQFADHYRFLVLGSGRLHVFQKGGDSLAGRYYQFHLWPFTLAELTDQRLSFEAFTQRPLHFLGENADYRKHWDQLFRLSGYPEPYLAGKDTTYRRWSTSYHTQLIREDIRNMTEIKSIDEVEILFSLLPSRVGSLLSVASLARDLQVSFNTVLKWIKTFESFYLIFLISPWSKKISRAITKERKLYLFDYAAIPSPAARYENMVALELLRAVSNWNDLGLGKFDLHYLRNKDGEETDFMISRDHQPFLLIETRLSDDTVSKGLRMFQNTLQVPAVQLLHASGTCKLITNQHQQILVAGASCWLPILP